MMATKTIDRSPPTASTSSRSYKDDLFGWVEDQVALLENGLLLELDAKNVADELGDVGKEQYEKLQSAIRVVLHHLLKWDHQPTHRSKSWVFSIRTQRRQIARVLKKNPSLKPHIGEAITEGYEDARDDAQEETGLLASALPSTCPYDWDAILTKVIEFEGVRTPENK